MSELYRCPVCRAEYDDAPTAGEPCTTEGCPTGGGSRDPITRATPADEALDLYLFNYGQGVR